MNDTYDSFVKHAQKREDLEATMRNHMEAEARKQLETNQVAFFCCVGEQNYRGQSAERMNTNA